MVVLGYARVLLNQLSVECAERVVRVARLVIYELFWGCGVGEVRDFEKWVLEMIFLL